MFRGKLSSLAAVWVDQVFSVDALAGGEEKSWHVGQATATPRTPMTMVPFPLRGWVRDLVFLAAEKSASPPPQKKGGGAGDGRRSVSCRADFSPERLVQEPRVSFAKTEWEGRLLGSDGGGVTRAFRSLPSGGVGISKDL